MTSLPSTAKPSVDLLGYAFAIGGAVLFFPQRHLHQARLQYGVGTETVLALRMLIAVRVYLVIMATLFGANPGLKARLNWRIVLGSMAVGILGYYVSSSLDFRRPQLHHRPVRAAGALHLSVLRLIFGVLFFNDRMSWSVVPGMLMSYAGLLIIFGWNLATNPDGLVTGTLLILASAITFALYSTWPSGR